MLRAPDTTDPRPRCSTSRVMPLQKQLEQLRRDHDGVRAELAHGLDDDARVARADVHDLGAHHRAEEERGHLLEQV